MRAVYFVLTINDVNERTVQRLMNNRRRTHIVMIVRRKKLCVHMKTFSRHLYNTHVPAAVHTIRFTRCEFKFQRAPILYLSCVCSWGFRVFPLKTHLTLSVGLCQRKSRTLKTGLSVSPSILTS